MRGWWTNPDAEVVGTDNLNTHQLGSLYEAFEPGASPNASSFITLRRMAAG